MGRFLEACVITTAIDDLINNRNKQGTIAIDATFTPITSLTARLLNEDNQAARQQMVGVALQDRLAKCGYRDKFEDIKQRLFYQTTIEILDVLQKPTTIYPTLVQ